MAIVLAAVFAAAWLMQRLQRLWWRPTGAIKVVTSIALGAKERAVLVQLGKQQVLLGVAPGRVNTLHVLAEPLPAPGFGGSTASQAAGAARDTPNFKAAAAQEPGDVMSRLRAARLLLVLALPVGCSIAQGIPAVTVQTAASAAARPTR